MGYQTYDAAMGEGRQYEVGVKELSRRGSCLARIDGFVTLVPHTRLGSMLGSRSCRFATASLLMNELNKPLAKVKVTPLF